MRLALFLISIFVAALAHAQNSAPYAGGVPSVDFERLDRNRDGYVSRTEAIADQDVLKRFAQFDLDRDGQLSVAEYLMLGEDIDQRVMRDAVLMARVKAALLAEKDLPSLRISVAAYEGMVTLSGSVASPDMASRAGRVTRTVSGVREVQNNIVVR